MPGREPAAIGDANGSRCQGRRPGRPVAALLGQESSLRPGTRLPPMSDDAELDDAVRCHDGRAYRSRDGRPARRDRVRRADGLRAAGPGRADGADAGRQGARWRRWPARQVDHLERVRDRLAELGADLMEAMEPFHRPFDDFHAHTRPKDWLEGLMWVYVGSGFADDFYAEVAVYVDAGHPGAGRRGAGRRRARRVRGRAGARPASRPTRASPAGSPCGAAGWSGRRSARRSGWPLDRAGLTALLMGVERPGMDLPAVSQTFSRLVENHAARMRRLGLQP